MRALSSLILLTSMVAGQRPFFAGTRPIGFPETPNRTTTESLDNRFGEGTTERLPLEANGDRDLVDRLSKLPVDKQPFWFINWQALEEQRKKPQTYPQRPNVFVDSIPFSMGNTNNRFQVNGTFLNSNAAAELITPSLNSSESKRRNPVRVQEITGPQSTTPRIQINDRLASPDSGFAYPNSGDSNTENSNTGFLNLDFGVVKPPSESSGKTEVVQQIPNTQNQEPVIKIDYPQQNIYRRPGGYGR